MIAEIVEKVRVLSQERGLFDHEIADELGCHRVTVTRCRERHGIPRPKLENRADKQQICKECGHVDYIKRKQHIHRYCTSCRKKKAAALKEKKRAYMRAYDKKKKHSEGMLPK
jgi:hypothetical protein